MPQKGDTQTDQERDRAMLMGMLKLLDHQKLCKETGNPFKLTNKLFATLLGRSEKWVEKTKQHIKKCVYDDTNINQTKERSGKPPKLSQQQKRSLTFGSANKRRKSLRKTTKLFNRNNRSNITVSKSWVHKLRHKAQLKPFHRRNAPIITEPNVEHRLALSKYFVNFFQTNPDVLENMIFIDEFFIYHLTKCNTKNDVIWAKSRDDIPNDIAYNKYPKNSQCVGICVAISSVAVWYDIKEEGQSWDGNYFRTKIIPSIKEWANKPNNVPDPSKMIIQHDCCPGWKAHTTQSLLVQCFGMAHFIPQLDDEANPIPRWPGNSPDMNPVENFGSIFKEKTEELIDRCNTEVNKAKLLQLVERAINESAQTECLLKNLVRSFQTRCQKVIDGGGKPLEY